MKNAFQFIILASVGTLALTASHASDKTKAMEATPSAFYRVGDRWQRDAASLVMLERADLRGIFATKAQIDSRKQRRIAIFDRLRESREVAVAENETVASFLQRCGMVGLWKTSWQPQIRLIKEDSLLQSPGRFDADSAAQFLALPISAGDILIVTLQQ